MAADASAPEPTELREIASALGRVEAEIGELKGRVFAVESAIGRFHLAQNLFQTQMAALIGRIDRFEDRFARIERRLDQAGGRDK